MLIDVLRDLGVLMRGHVLTVQYACFMPDVRWSLTTRSMQQDNLWFRHDKLTAFYFMCFHQQFLGVDSNVLVQGAAGECREVPSGSRTDREISNFQD